MFRKQVKCSDCGFLGWFAFGGSPDEAEPLAALNSLMIQKELGFYEPREYTKERREAIATNSELEFNRATCVKHVWYSTDLKDKPQADAMKFLAMQRNCPFFYPYNPGYSPTEHKELYREAKTRSLLIKGMILAAAIGAIIGALIGRLVS